MYQIMKKMNLQAIFNIQNLSEEDIEDLLEYLTSFTKELTEDFKCECYLEDVIYPTENNG